MSLDAQPFKLGAMDRGRAVIADLADVAGAQAPLLAGSDRGCDLAAGQDIGRTKFDFGSQRGIVRQPYQRVGGVQSDADQVNLGRFIHDRFS